MKIVVFGATGGIGKQVIVQGLEAGHEITAFVRRSKDLPLYVGKIIVLEGDLLDLPSVEKAVQGQDAVIGTFGAHSKKDAHIYPKATGNIIYAMKLYGVQRLVCVTSAAVDDGPGMNFFFRKIVKPLFLKPIYTQMKIMEDNIKQSELEWTIVGPGLLTDDPHTGKYRVVENVPPKGGRKISRADVADLLIKEATSQQDLHKKVAIVY